MSKLEKRTLTQLLKHIESDLKKSMYFEKTLKYIKEKDIEPEELFGVYIDTYKSISGLPLYLVYSGLIKNYSYTYDGISLAILFDVYDIKIRENIIVKNGGEYILDNVNVDIIATLLTKIKDSNVIKQILLQNKEILFKPLEKIIVPICSSYEHSYENYLDLLISKNEHLKYNLNNHHHLYYRGEDSAKMLKDDYTKQIDENNKLINLILFDMNLSIDEIEKLLYSNVIRSIAYSDKELFEKILKCYGYNNNLQIPNNYSSYYMPLITLVILRQNSIYKESEMGAIIKDKESVLNLCIQYNIDFLPNELFSQTKSEDVYKGYNQKSLHKESRTYKYLIEEFQKLITDDKNDNNRINYDKQVNRKAFYYYLEKSNSLTKDIDFWNRVATVSNQFYDMLKPYNNSIQKEYSIEEIKTLLNDSIKNSDITILNDVIVSNRTKYISYFEKLVNGRTMLFDVDLRNMDFTFKLLKLLLDNGLRTNNHIGNMSLIDSLKNQLSYPFKDEALLEKFESLVNQYPNNNKPFVSFDILTMEKLLGSGFGGVSRSNYRGFLNFSQYLIKEVKRILCSELQYIAREDVLYLKAIDESIVIVGYENSSKIIQFNISIVDGNEITLENFTFKD